MARRRRYISALTLAGMLAAYDNYVPVAGRANQIANAYADGVTQLTGINRNNKLLHSVAGIALAGIGSQMIGQVAPQSKIPLGRYGVKP